MMPSIPNIAKRELTVACCVVLALALAQPIHAVHAQTALGTASVYWDSLPVLLAPADTSDITGSIQDSATAAQDRADVARPTLRHLPASAAGWRITGEAGHLGWRVYMTADEAARPQSFRLAYTPSVSVLPDISTIALSINGAVVGRTGIASPDDLKPIDFAIPPNVLRHGFNDVRIAVEQRHRVDCSIDATYELWTQIESDNSGFLALRSQIPLDITDLAALRPRGDGRLVIRVVSEGKLKPRRVEQTIVASEVIALAARAEAPLVSFTPDPEADFGVNLMVGTVDELADTIKSLPDHADISGSTVLFARSPQDASPMLVVTGRSDDELSDAIDQLAAASSPHAGARKGDETRDINHVRITGGETVRLQDIGLSSLEFSGRALRIPIGIEMPSDFMAADYGKFSVNLSGAYSPGLLAGAQVLISLNGKDSASVPLSDAAGGLLHHDDIFIPLTALRPGHNVLEIAARLPNASDKSCDTTIPITDAAQRLLLLGDTQIRFPQIARVGQMPELAQTAAGGYPYSIPGSKPTLYMPKPDRESMSAALTLVVRLAVAADRTIPFDLALSNPGDQPGHGLVVAPARSLDPALMTEIGLDPGAVQRGWKDRASKAGDPATSDAADDSSVTGSLRDEAPANASLLNINTFQAEQRFGPNTVWAGILARRSYLDQARELVRPALQKIYNLSSAAISSALAPFTSVSTMAAVNIGPKASLILAQGYRTGDTSGVIAIATAPDSATLARSVEALVDPVRWSELNGRLAVMNHAGRILDLAKASDVRFTATQQPSLGNLRLIAAGWLSLHSSFYVAFALMLAGLLALLSHLLVKNVGRSNP